MGVIVDDVITLVDVPEGVRRADPLFDDAPINPTSSPASPPRPICARSSTSTAFPCPIRGTTTTRLRSSTPSSTTTRRSRAHARSPRCRSRNSPAPMPRSSRSAGSATRCRSAASSSSSATRRTRSSRSRRRRWPRSSTGAAKRFHSTMCGRLLGLRGDALSSTVDGVVLGHDGYRVAIAVDAFEGLEVLATAAASSTRPGRYASPSTPASAELSNSSTSRR